MNPTGLKKRVARLAVAATLAVAGAVTLGQAPAQAATCPTGNFCWYYLTYLGGSQGTQYSYTNGWVRMSSLVDNSESSYDNQYSDWHCPNYGGNPQVFLSDTYYSMRWEALLGQYRGETHNTFNSVNTNYGYLNMNDRFNDIWNACR